MEHGYSTQEMLKPLGGSSRSPGTRQNQLAFLTSPGFYDWIGDHHPDGIVFISGPGIQSNQKISASVLDIVPTVLALMDIPLPDYLEGKVIKDAFINLPKGTTVHWAPKNDTKNLLTEGEMKKIRELRSKL